MWCVPAIDAEYVERMEDVLTLYAAPVDEREPVVCLDERPVVLHDADRPELPARPGQPTRRDYEYVRCGTANVFCIVEPKTGRHLTHATRRRTRRDFARALRKIARRHCRARMIHLVVDNLNTHSETSCIEAFGQTAGAALWRRVTLHYTPKHGSWLNAAELEASLVARECLGKRRIHALPMLKREVSRWTRLADANRRTINWTFRVDRRQAHLPVSRNQLASVRALAALEPLVIGPRRNRAIGELDKLTDRYPNNAYVPYLLGNIYMQNFWWSNGSAAYSQAIKNNPAYRNDPTLNRNAVRALRSNKMFPKGAAFISTKLGPAALPYLAEAAESKNPVLRERAARLRVLMPRSLSSLTSRS
jgi:hypothetical protein